jgi:cellulose synthase/poly-beta-1,6-N-acetylglucosamine synthase-like glycosyltransferase
LSLSLFISFAMLAVATGAVFYLYVLLCGSMRRSGEGGTVGQSLTRFVVAIPAHNEASCIGTTVATVLQADYPVTNLDVCVVADHCEDDTAAVAQQAGARVFERQEGTRTGKGSALSWLFQRVFADSTLHDAIVVFDADTHVDAQFFVEMHKRIVAGDPAIQGNHIIRNPQASWFAALTWAMFIIDNRVQNRGRANLGFSAKNMGDAICFQERILRQLGWGEGLTEDYDLRHRLLLNGIRIAYDPKAISRGEAATSLAVARKQRARWLKGTYDASRRHVWGLLSQGLTRGDAALIDGAIQSILPSFSTLTVMSVAMLVLHLFFDAPVILTAGWLVLVVLLAGFPFLALMLERAPWRAYAAILLGPFFILWRTVVALRARIGRSPVTWVRTKRSGEA